MNWPKVLQRAVNGLAVIGTPFARDVRGMEHIFASHLPQRSSYEGGTTVATL